MKVGSRLFGLLAVFCLCVSSAFGVQYTVTDLGRGFSPMDINNAGLLAGTYRDPPNSSTGYAATWDGGAVTNLGKPINSNYPSYASRINENGRAVGKLNLSSYLWTESGPTLLTNLANKESEAGSINIHDKIAGWSRDSDNNPRGCVWENNVITDLGVLTGDVYSYAYDINDSGQVVGFSNNGGFGRAVIWNNNVISALPMLTDWLGTQASKINANGWVIGYGVTPEASYRAVLWNGAGMQNLGLLDGARTSYANGINNTGQVVGKGYYQSLGEYRPFIWDQASGMVDLNTLIPSNSGWVLNSAEDINDGGLIVGKGRIGSVSHYFLLTPVPEPSSLIALGSGCLACIGGLMRKRTHKTR